MGGRVRCLPCQDGTYPRSKDQWLQKWKAHTEIPRCLRTHLDVWDQAQIYKEMRTKDLHMQEYYTICKRKMAAALSYRYSYPDTQRPGKQPRAESVHANKRTYWVELHGNLTSKRQRTSTSPWKQGQQNHVNLLQMGISSLAVGILCWCEISVWNTAVFRAVRQCHFRSARYWKL